jgi:phage/plasmid primase-like uncharacterized protein
MRGLLLIPMMDVTTGEFCALHRVFGRPGADGKFSKGWCSPAGGVFPIGVDVPRGVIFVGEGIATVLSTYDAWIEGGEPEAPDEYVPCCTVLATMDSGNLVRQASAIRRKYANRRLFAVKDADEAGEKVARAAIEAGFDGAIEAPVGR